MQRNKNNISIKVDSLSKIYPLYNSPKDRMKEALHPRRKKYHKDFYALRDVSFEVERGDSLGIIGQNGSGKSTLLKILSRVLTPSSGKFCTNGRVISLLELGSGFNPELTGVENIFFYGTILGFSKKAIKSKLQEILDFADIGQFVYQPLKVYSSGMSARLAFAVASHVDPDILILDEVLAVGDIRFQQKCFRVMRNFIDQKKTVLLASHSTNSINDFCNKTIWLNEGELKDFGLSKDVTKKYIGFMTYGMETKTKEVSKNKKDEERIEHLKNKKDILETSNIKWTDVDKLDSFGNRGGYIEKIALCIKDSEKPVKTLKGGEWLSLYAKINVKESLLNPGLGVRIKDKRGNGIFTVNNYLYEKKLRPLNPGEEIIIRTDFKFPLLMAGKYTVVVALSDGDQLNHLQHHWIHDALVLTVDNHDQKFKRSNILVINDDCYNIELLDA